MKSNGLCCLPAQHRLQPSAEWAPDGFPHYRAALHRALYPTSSNSIQSQLRVVQALDVDNRHKADDVPRQLSWIHEGQYIAQDVARGLYFLHNIDVRFDRTRALCCT